MLIESGEKPPTITHVSCQRSAFSPPPNNNCIIVDEKEVSKQSLYGYPLTYPTKLYSNLSIIFVWFFDGSSSFFPGIFTCVKGDKVFKPLKKLSGAPSSTTRTNIIRPAFELFSKIPGDTLDENFMATLDKLRAAAIIIYQNQNKNIGVYCRTFSSPKDLMKDALIKTNFERFFMLKWGINVKGKI